MPTRSKTLRKLPVNTRKYTRLIDELQSITRRLNHFQKIVQELELWASAAAAQARAQEPEPVSKDQLELFPEREDLRHYKVAPEPLSEEARSQLSVNFHPDTSISTPGTGEGRMP